MLLVHSRGIGCFIVVSLTAILARAAWSADCNGNGVDDAADIGLQPARAFFNDGDSGYWGSGSVRPIADLDGDLDLDLVGVNNVLLNDGVGNFELREISTSRFGDGESMVTVDADGDGDIDLVRSRRSCSSCDPPQSAGFAILFNRGDATFGEPREFPLPYDFDAITAADLDGDSRADLAVVNGDLGHVSMLFGIGDGSWESPLSFQAGGSPIALVTADLDGDNDLDLAVVNNLESGNVALLLNVGNRAFQPPIYFPAGETPRSLLAADLDGDGAVDLAVGGGGGLSVLFGDGLGGFPARLLVVDGFADKLAAADLDEDGRMDLAVGVVLEGSFTRAVIRNAGGRSFDRPLQVNPFGSTPGGGGGFRRP